MQFSLVMTFNAHAEHMPSLTQLCLLPALATLTILQASCLPAEDTPTKNKAPRQVGLKGFKP